METEYKQVKESEETRWIYCFRQVLVALVTWTSFLITGMSLGIPTVAVPQLRKEANATSAVSNEMASWLTSVFGIAGTAGLFITIPAGYFMGRKFTMIMLSIVTLISSAIIYFSKTVMYLLISQLVFGLSFAGEVSVLLLIITEYSSPKYRGVFLTIKSATFYWGMWIANTMGIFTDYRYVGLVGVFCSVYSLIISLIIPESPYWLASKGRHDESAAAHRWLKGVSDDAERELDVLLKSHTKTDETLNSVKAYRKYLQDFLAAIKLPEIFKPLLLCFLVSSLYHFSGKMVCSVYAVEMMKKFVATESTAYIGVLALDGFTVLGMYIGCGLSKILKRRTLLLSTSITGTAFLYAMSINLYLIKWNVLPENDYVIMALLVGYTLSLCCGTMILSTSISAELLPMRFRSLCVLIYAIFGLMLPASILKVSPYVFHSFGFQGVYFGFGICSSILIVLTYKYLPETKDRTLLEITEIFKKQTSQENPSERDLLESNINRQ